MQQIHNQLKKHSAWYAAWHEHPRHGLVHWMFFLAVGVLTVLFLTVQIEVSFLSTKASGTVTLNPGDNIQAIVNANPAGTVYTFNPGTYRMQSITPKSGDQFIGSLDPGGSRVSILNGAKQLTAFSREGNYWAATGQTQESSGRYGSCEAGYSRCDYPEDLFFDDAPLAHAANLSDVGAGKWHFDYANDRIYFYDDPAGRKVETSVKWPAFKANASGVTIKNLIIEKYANSALFGAIEGGSGDGPYPSGTDWVIENNEIRLNHGAAIGPSHRWQIRNNKLHTNGQIGLTGGGDNILFEGNELYGNNYAHYSVGWEAGGVKFSRTNNLILRNNISHHNRGPGLWTDIDNRWCLYEGNNIYDNTGEGIFHEISQDCVIRNNTLAGNGLVNPGWLYGANILVSASKNVEVYGNTVEVSAQGGHGIAGINQARGTSGNGTGVWETVNLYVHNNIITHKGSTGASGGADDTVSGDNNYQRMWTGNNRFDSNTYHVPSLSGPRWDWKGDRDWNGFRAQGQEANGFADTNISDPSPPPPVPPPAPSCAGPASGAFTGCYYDNMDFTSLKLTRTDPVIDFNWADGSPDVSIAPFTYSVSWEGKFNFEEADYEFTVTVDDGAKLYLDGALVLDQWFDQPPTTYAVTKNVSAGEHAVKLAYYQNGGGTRIKLAWQKQAAPVPPPSEPVSILNYGLTGKTATTAAINWSTNVPSTGLVSYGRSATALTQSFTDGNLTDAHTVKLTGLRKNTTYYYRITAVSQDGSSTAVSPVASFKTNRK